MDGEDLAVSCKDVLDANLCGVCHPESALAKFIRWAVLNPFRPILPLHKSSAYIETDSDDEFGGTVVTEEMAKVMDAVTASPVYKVDHLASFQYLMLTYLLTRCIHLLEPRYTLLRPIPALWSMKMR
jgi:hypothetical protein